MAKKKEPAAAASTAVGGAAGGVQAPKKAADAKGKVLKGLWHAGRSYGPNDAAAFANLKLPEATMQRLVDKGVVEGFGYEKSSGEAAESEE